MTGNEKFQTEELDGMDISNTFFNNTPIREDIHYYRQDTLVGIRHNEWKMYINDPNPWDDELSQKDMPALYHIEHDPSEKYNISKNNPDIVKKMKDLSNKHILSIPKTPSKYGKILPSYKKAYDDYNKKL